MTRFLIATFAAFVCFCPSVSQGAEEKLVQPLEVRKVVADGKHNAFTMKHFEDKVARLFSKPDKKNHDNKNHK